MRIRSHLSRLIKRSIRRFGFDVRLLPGRYHFHLYDLPDQLGIMQEQDVRTILDVGACIGDTASAYHRLFPGADVYAFEPFAESYAKLADRFRDHSHIKAFELAVADKTEQRSFYVNEYVETNSLLPAGSFAPQLGVLNNVGECQVKTVSLDDFCEEHSIGHVNILKMDVQGGEMSVLHGAASLLEAQAIDLIFTEIGFAEIYHGQPLFRDLDARLSEAGYVLYGLYNINEPFQVDNAPIWGGDAIYINRQLHQSLAEQDPVNLDPRFGMTFQHAA